MVKSSPDRAKEMSLASGDYWCLFFKARWFVWNWFLDCWSRKCHCILKFNQSNSPGDLFVLRCLLAHLLKRIWVVPSLETARRELILELSCANTETTWATLPKRIARQQVYSARTFWTLGHFYLAPSCSNLLDFPKDTSMMLDGTFYVHSPTARHNFFVNFPVIFKVRTKDGFIAVCLKVEQIFNLV